MALQILRVVAGHAKGRKLRAPVGDRTRPTSDRLKEALFSSLGEQVGGAQVLDLYAGSGALGIEALSRGAAGATFVDEDGRAIQAIRDNLATTGFTGKATVVHLSVERYVSRPAPRTASLVLIDPPYELGLPSHVLVSLLAGGYVDEASTVLVEASARKSPLEAPEGFWISWERRYGDSVLVRLGLAGGAN